MFFMARFLGISSVVVFFCQQKRQQIFQTTCLKQQFLASSNLTSARHEIERQKSEIESLRARLAQAESESDVERAKSDEERRKAERLRASNEELRTNIEVKTTVSNFNSYRVWIIIDPLNRIQWKIQIRDASSF